MHQRPRPPAIIIPTQYIICIISGSTQPSENTISKTPARATDKEPKNERPMTEISFGKIRALKSRPARPITPIRAETAKISTPSSVGLITIKTPINPIKMAIIRGGPILSLKKQLP